MTPAEALSCAHAAAPLTPLGVDPDDPLNLLPGTRVTVSPSDYAEVRVAGKLVASTGQSLSQRRHDPGVDTMVVHLPKIGYEITVA